MRDQGTLQQVKGCKDSSVRNRWRTRIHSSTRIDEEDRSGRKMGNQNKTKNPADEEKEKMVLVREIDGEPRHTKIRRRREMREIDGNQGTQQQMKGWGR
jgi:hypothetical protein